MQDSRQFPKNFFWGAATSAHQVEGNTHNDWSEWEKGHADRLSREAELHFGALPSWPRIYDEATNPENYISGICDDHYHRFQEDFDIAQKLGHNAHRFSLEWSRIEPQEGVYNEDELEHYRHVIRALRDRGMEPFVSLWHWTLPIWLRNKGGALNPEFPSFFRRYCEQVVRAFKQDAIYFLTLNEPEIYTINGYVRAVWPPQKKGILHYFNAARHLILAHRAGYDAIKSVHPAASVGVAFSLVYFESCGGMVNDSITSVAESLRNNYFLDRTEEYLDFIGVNYYMHNRIDYGLNKNKNHVINDMGWEVYSRGIYEVLRRMQKFEKPIYITENGLADAQDEKRGAFIRDHLMWMKKAIDEGIDVRGYFYWSLLDNFEWDKGFWPRFGLVEVDRKTLERRIRPSAWVYKKIIEDGL